METKTLNDGVQIPVYGFGTFQIPADGSTYQAVREALDLGIRHIDTAVAYFNEHEVGQAIKDSGVPRSEIFVTSKLWLRVSNMTVKIWNQFIPQFDTLPSVNQIEFNPYCQRKEIRKLMADAGVALEAWGPLGQGNQALLTDPVIVKIAEKHGKDVGQVILRFEYQEGAIIFPKSTNSKRMKSNMEIFDFSLSADEMQEIRDLDTGKGCFDHDAPGVAEFLLANFDVHANEN
ncbi:aldo/keto reductase [uncultured Enterococcus sp.]|uniref:aldo/keto reductase n=1 Tax=uncultured Enterococcus sp. TaxID=167972 RepID=UPI0026386D85|nr:aldo/keto reductase [uncultured Enterococcus sp.]